MTRKNVTLSTVFSLGGDWALASNNNSPGEGDITSLRQISTHPPPEVREIYFAFKWFPPALCSLAEWKQRSRPCWEVGDYWTTIMSPSPGELLFDASAQSPPSEKTVESVTFFLVTDKWRRFLNCSWSFRSSCAIQTQGLPERIVGRWS